MLITRCETKVRGPAVILLLLLSSPLQAISPDDGCWARVAERYKLHPLELKAHACVESSMRPQAMNTSHQARTNSVDIGLMQINSRWLPKLEKRGITREALMDACTNIEVGAEILADLKQRHGDSWTATGAYNAACTQLKGAACEAARSKYAWKVYNAMQRLSERGRC